jgi:hypothetical protein
MATVKSQKHMEVNELSLLLSEGLKSTQKFSKYVLKNLGKFVKYMTPKMKRVAKETGAITFYGGKELLQRLKREKNRIEIYSTQKKILKYQKLIEDCADNPEQKLRDNIDKLEKLNFRKDKIREKINRIKAEYNTYREEKIFKKKKNSEPKFDSGMGRSRKRVTKSKKKVAKSRR